MFRKKYSITISPSMEQSENSQDCKTEENQKCPIKPKDTVKYNPLLGFFYIFTSSLCFNITSVIVKKLTYMSPGNLSLIRNAFIFSGCLPIAVYSVKEVFGERKDRAKLFARGILGSTALYCNLTAYRYLPLSEAAIVLSTTPSLTSLLAFFYLKEPCGAIQVLSIILTTAGVLLSVHLPELLNGNGTVNRFDYYYIGGLAAAVGCVLFLSLTLVTLRKMKHIHFSVPALYYGFIGVIENGLINSVTSTFEYPDCGMDPILLILLGIFSFIAQCCMGLAVQKEAVGIMSVIRASMDIILAMVFQLIFFDEKLDMYNISGACLVIVSVSTMGVRNWLSTLPEESNTRKKMKFFLL